MTLSSSNFILFKSFTCPELCPDLSWWRPGSPWYWRNARSAWRCGEKATTVSNPKSTQKNSNFFLKEVINFQSFPWVSDHQGGISPYQIDILIMENITGASWEEFIFFTVNWTSKRPSSEAFNIQSCCHSDNYLQLFLQLTWKWN